MNFIRLLHYTEPFYWRKKNCRRFYAIFPFIPIEFPQIEIKNDDMGTRDTWEIWRMFRLEEMRITRKVTTKASKCKSILTSSRILW